MSERDAYARAGVSQRQADAAVEALVAHLRQIDPGRPSRVVPLPGHYASVLRIDDGAGVAIATDGVGTKMLVAERLGRFDTIGIDCVAMNVNDLICVGAEPIAMLDFILCREADPEICERIGAGLRAGAEAAGIEIPGGEIAQVGEIVSGWELSGSAIGEVDLEAIVSGAAIEPGDPVLGLPSSGLHSNGYTLARRVLDGDPPRRRSARPARWAMSCSSRPRSTCAPCSTCCASDVEVRGLAHITGDGLAKPASPPGRGRLRDRRPAAGAADLRADRRAVATVSDDEMHEVFNMGCGFCCVVAAADEELGARSPARPLPGDEADRPGDGRARGRSVESDRMRIAILIFDRLTALDAVGPYEVLSRLPGAELSFVAKEPGPKRTDTQRAGADRRPLAR